VLGSLSLNPFIFWAQVPKHALTGIFLIERAGKFINEDCGQYLYTILFSIFLCIVQ